MSQEQLPQTEAVNPNTNELDDLATVELVAILAGEHRVAIDAVLDVREPLARAVDAIAERLRSGGRLHYVGAGTSGRLGVLDASEMPPTFGTDPALVCAHIAGGREALTGAIEGAEDDGEAGADEMRDHVQPGDAVVGISASGGAAFVVQAIRAAREIGAWTLGVANTDPAPLLLEAHLGIVLATGAEPVAGSTRMKAGSAQKIFLNTLSTAVMVRLAKVYGNLMVDLVATSSKLRRRALRLVMQLTQNDEARASELLSDAAGNVKLAVLMERKHLDLEQARSLLEANAGSLRGSLR